MRFPERGTVLHTLTCLPGADGKCIERTNVYGAKIETNMRTEGEQM